MAKQRTGFRLEGLKEVKENLNKEIQKIEGRSLKGLIRGAIVIHRAAEPMIPVHWGNLRASWFYVTSKGDVQIEGGFEGTGSAQAQEDTRQATQKAVTTAQQKGAKGAFVIIGLGANYAIFVHEAPEDTDFQRPTAEVKFLEKAIKRNQREVLQEIANSAAFK